MILDLDRFIREENAFWKELEEQLALLDRRAEHRMNLAESKRFYYLYRRAASDLARISTFAAEPSIRGYLESLVARAYSEIHETRDKPYRLRPLVWFFGTFPQTFRRRIRAFQVSLLITIAGILFGAGAIALDPGSKDTLMPFSHLHGDPNKRVQEEESQKQDHMHGAHGSFAAMLMVNNIRVSIFAMGFGIIWGIGTVILLFYNGLILGAVALDYIQAGQSVFLAGWLLPHGSVEIPAVLIAGQAGLVLANALLGWGNALSLRERFRAVSSDVITLIFGVAILLVWAGIIESFLSQYHQPVVPYALKITFGAIELILLFAFLLRSGREKVQAGVRGAAQ